MANMLTGVFGNANEQVFYGEQKQMAEAQMIFPNGEKGTVGGGEFITVTKYMTGLFGMQIPYTTVEFVPNKVVEIKRADDKIAQNIAYDDGKVSYGYIGGNVGVSEAKPMQKSCPDGWRDDGLMCLEPIEMKCDVGVLENGLCMSEKGSFFAIGVPRMSGGQIKSKY
jgi:hypothetical protein